MANMKPTPYQFDKWNCKVITLKKYKIVFKIRKDYVGIIFLRALQDLYFKQFHKYD